MPQARSPHLVGPCADPADELVGLACLTYGVDDAQRLEQAAALLAERPELGRASAWTAAVTGDAERRRELVAADATLVQTDGSAYAWVPLLCLASSRLDVGAAAALLEAAARR